MHWYGARHKGSNRAPQSGKLGGVEKVRDDVHPYMTHLLLRESSLLVKKVLLARGCTVLLHRAFALYARNRCQRESAQLSGGEIQLKKRWVRFGHVNSLKSNIRHPQKNQLTEGY